MSTFNYEAMCNRVDALRDQNHSKSAADSGGVEDPRNKGTASIPDHPDGDNAAKTKIPEGSRPVNDKSVDDGVTQHVTRPGGTGENMPPAPGDQNAKDNAFTSPTTPIEKIALAANNLKALRDGGAAPAPQEKEAAAAEPTPAEPAEPAEKSAATEGEKKPEGVDVEKTASGIELSDDAHIKLASEILDSEEGRAWALEFLTERQGEKVAHAMMNDAANLQQEMEKAAGEEAYMAKAAADQQDANVSFIDGMLKEASPQEREIFMKCAAAHTETINANYDGDYEAQDLYKMGAADAGMAQEMMMAGGDPGMPTLPGAGGVEDGQIQEVIAAMVQAGELTPEEAQAILAQLTADGGGAAPAEEAPAEEPAAKEASAEEQEKSASAAEITQEIFNQHVTASAE